MLRVWPQCGIPNNESYHQGSVDARQVNNESHISLRQQYILCQQGHNVKEPSGGQHDLRTDEVNKILLEDTSSTTATTMEFVIFFFFE